MREPDQALLRAEPVPGGTVGGWPDGPRTVGGLHQVTDTAHGARVSPGTDSADAAL